MKTFLLLKLKKSKIIQDKQRMHKFGIPLFTNLLSSDLTHSSDNER